MNKSIPSSASPFAFSDALVAAIVALMGDAPDIAAEVAELEAAAKAFDLAQKRAGSEQARQRRQDIDVRIARARLAVQKLSLREELDEDVGGERKEAEQELDSAMRAADVLVGENETLVEIIDERREALFAARQKLAAKLKPWRTEVLARLDEAEDHAGRALAAVGRGRYLLDALGRMGTVPGYHGALGAPSIDAEPRVDHAMRIARRVDAALGRP